MAEFTFEKPEKKYVGHITFGRVKSIGKQDSRALHEAATVLAGRAFGDWTVDMLHLVRSQLFLRWVISFDAFQNQSELNRLE